MRREKRVTFQGPVKEQQPDGMSHRGDAGDPPPPPLYVVVRSSCQENDPADARPSAHQSVLESVNPRMDSECASGCIWSTTARLRDSRPPE